MKKLNKYIEKNFLSKLTLKSIKLFTDEKFKENWKNFYNEKEINNLIPNNNETTILINTNCLLSKYKKEYSLKRFFNYKNRLRKNKNNKNEFNINLLTGKGILYLKNVKIYEGNFYKGESNGLYRYINTKGVYYEGLFINGILNGKGEIILIDEYGRKNIYKGDIKNFKSEGSGEERTYDYIYEGGFSKDLKHGIRKMIYNRGDSYDDVFKNRGNKR